MSDFRKPRPDVPIIPQSALYRRTPLTPFKAPKGRKGRKPRGQKLKPKTLSQFNKFHSEAARNKERDRAEQERIDAIKERDEARRERRERLQIEDRRYAAKVITDARDRAAERNFRAEQLRLLRQQAAAPPPALPPPPAINIAPPAVNIAPAAVEVRPVINIPAAPEPRRVGGRGGGQVELSAEEAQEARDAIYAGLVGRPAPAGGADVRASIPRWAAAQLEQERERAAAAERGLDAERQNRLAITDRARQEIQTEQGLRGQAERDREAALEAVEQATQEALQIRQREAEALRVAVERQREAEGLQTQLQALEAREARRLEEAQGARGEAEQELTQQLSRAQRARNQAEDRARELQGRAEELERHNQSLQQQRNQDPVNRAAIRREVVDGVREEIEIDIGDRLEQQYRDLVLRQASEAQRNDANFQRRLEQEAFRVGDRLEIPFGGEEVSDEDRPFRINPFRPENEEFLRRALAESRVLQGGLSQLRREQGITEKVPVTQEQVDREIEAIRRIERDRQRQRLGRGGINPPSLAGFEREFSSEEEEEQQPPQVSRRNTTLDPAQIDPLTQSQLDRDFDVIEARRPVDFTLEFDEEAADRQARGLPLVSSLTEEEQEAVAEGRAELAPVPPPRETPREQAERQALERQASQERVSRITERREERRAGGIPLPSDVVRDSGGDPVLVDVSLEDESPDSSLESLESEQDNWEIVRSNFEAGNQSTFHRGKQGRDSLRPDSTHFSFRDDEGFLGKGKTGARFQGEDLVILDVNPKKGNVLVRTKDSVNKKLSQKERAEVEGNIKFGFLNNLVELGSINLQEIDHTLQPVEQTTLRGTPADIAAAVGGAVATAGGVVGNAALGAVRGAGQRAYEELPTAGQTGEALGRAAVAVGSGIAGVVRGAARAVTSPREPAVGEQTGGGILPRGLGRVEDVDE